jgi:radical SAM superfamily enzyme YgiQ (UPF0313 family)
MGIIKKGKEGMVVMKNDSISLLLIQSPCPQIENDDLDPPLGLLYIAAVVEQAGYHVEILDLSSYDVSQCFRMIEAKCCSFNFIGFSTYTSNYYLTLELLKHTKEFYPDFISIAGGPHATVLPSDVAQDFDYVVCGEAESCIVDILEGKTEKIIHAEPIANLDTLPLPAYHLVDINRYTRIVNGQKAISLLSTRGCPHQCTFCNSVVFTKKYFRARGPENMASEINYLIDHYGIYNFKFDDDLFTIRTERIKKIFSLTPKVNYRCFARADTLTKETCEILIETGCKHVSIGVESGSALILENMNKGETKDQIKNGLENARNAGLIIRIYLIVGFPGETDKTVQETMDFLDETPFDEFVVYPLIPYPGIPLLMDKEKYGITAINTDYSQYIQVGKERFTSFLLRTNTFDEKDVERWRSILMQHLENKLEKAWSSKKSAYK